MKPVYLDNTSTTKMLPEVKRAMLPYFDARYGNPSSRHRIGREAENALGSSRKKIANLLGCKEKEIIFTSGATEAVNLAIFGAALAQKHRGKHIVTSMIEHDAVLEPCRKLEEGDFDVTYLKPDEYGRIKTEQIMRAIRKDTILVSLMHVQNELGTIYPIEEFAAEVKRARPACAGRPAQAGRPDILFFSDGAQAFGKIPVNLENIDLYAISGHKIHGPKGAGALFARDGVRLKPIMHGGGQEQGFRPGTENIPAVVGFAKAAEVAYKNLKRNRAYIQKLRANFIKGIKQIENVRVNSPQDTIETIGNVAFFGVPAESLLGALEKKGIYASAGSACSMACGRRSHVLAALPVDGRVSLSSLRFGLSRLNTQTEINYAVKVLRNVVPRLRGK